MVFALHCTQQEINGQLEIWEVKGRPDTDQINDDMEVLEKKIFGTGQKEKRKRRKRRGERNRNRRNIWLLQMSRMKHAPPSKVVKSSAVAVASTNTVMQAGSNDAACCSSRNPS
jgi:hypothetical protein